jgi:hypothetical protein
MKEKVKATRMKTTEPLEKVSYENCHDYRTDSLAFPDPISKHALSLFALYWPKCLRACFENISGGLAAGLGGWLRCASVADFSRICALVAPRHPPRRARNPFPIYFQNTL